MDELERRLRESLDARSHDLEATPALWREVERRAVRRRRRGFLVGLSGLAAAAVVAAVAVPALLDLRETDQPQIEVGDAPDGVDDPDGPRPDASEPDEAGIPGTEPEGRSTPTDAATAAEPGAGAPAPEWAVATDGIDVFLLRGGERAALLVDRPDGSESRLAAVAVRPGSTPQDLTVAYLEDGEGMYALGWFSYRDGFLEVEPSAFPAPYQAQDMRTDGVVPNPVWSPDGDFLAWIEGGAGQEVALRAIAWTDGPGSTDANVANTSWSADVELSFGARLQEWTWVADDGTTASGQFVITDPLSGGEGGTSLVVFPVERQGDGALATDPNAPYLQPDHGPAYLDVANGHVGLGEDDVRYFLRVSGAGEGTVDLDLTAVQASDQGEELPVPEEIQRTSDPTAIWMTAGGDAALLGSGGRAWVAGRDGSLVMLDATVWHADFLLP